MIKTFADKHAEHLFNRRKRHKHLPNELQRKARRKLLAVDAATELKDLNVPPGNGLHPLKGKRKGQHAIKINDQWRICFRWNRKSKDAYDVEITDYHDE